MNDVAIVGAGPAGCAAAIELARAGARVLLLEKSSFPRHKVCGEFLSPEVAGILEELGCGAILSRAARIDSGRVLTPSGRALDFSFPTPAYGLSRASMDHALARQAVHLGVCFEQRVEIASVDDDTVTARDGRRFRARTVLMAAGRHSLLNPASHRGRSYYGFKAHFRGHWPARLDLHFLKGGYLGIAPIEGGRVNACALVEKRLLKDAEKIVGRILGDEYSREGDYLFTGPLQPGWQKSKSMAAGDAAAFVDPFTGDGISLALRSGRLAAQHLLRLLDGADVKRMQAAYRRELRRMCGRQLAASRFLRLGARVPFLEIPAARLLESSPRLRSAVFRITRGA